MTTFEHDGCEWYVNDTRGYLDAGPSCDECGACECDTPAYCGNPECDSPCNLCGSHSAGEFECIGLSVAYVCLDGGQALCEACAAKEGLPTCA